MAQTLDQAVPAPVVAATFQQGARAKASAGEESEELRLGKANHAPMDQESEDSRQVDRMRPELGSLVALAKCGAFPQRVSARAREVELGAELESVAPVPGVGAGGEPAAVPDRARMRSLEYWVRLRVLAMSAQGKEAWLLLERSRSR